MPGKSFLRELTRFGRANRGLAGTEYAGSVLLVAAASTMALLKFGPTFNPIFDQAAAPMEAAYDQVTVIHRISFIHVAAQGDGGGGDEGGDGDAGGGSGDGSADGDGSGGEGGSGGDPGGSGDGGSGGGEIVVASSNFGPCPFAYSDGSYDGDLGGETGINLPDLIVTAWNQESFPAYVLFHGQDTQQSLIDISVENGDGSGCYRLQTQDGTIYAHPVFGLGVNGASLRSDRDERLRYSFSERRVSFDISLPHFSNKERMSVTGFRDGQPIGQIIIEAFHNHPNLTYWYGMRFDNLGYDELEFRALPQSGKGNGKSNVMIGAIFSRAGFSGDHCYWDLVESGDIADPGGPGPDAGFTCPAPGTAGPTGLSG
jgi:hypothetical protein